VYTWYWWGNLSEKDHSEDPDIDGRIILRIDLQEMGCMGMDWIDVALDRDRWWAFLNVVINLKVL
jgi:hypothetical protein